MYLVGSAVMSCVGDTMYSRVLYLLSKNIWMLELESINELCNIYIFIYIYQTHPYEIKANNWGIILGY